MPSLSKHQSAQTTKLLFIGNTGAGKTGALASLAAAGYNIRVLDLDNGMDVLFNLLAGERSPYPKEALSRVEFETLTDPMRSSANGKLIPAKATVWQRAVKLLDRWDTESAKFGPLTTWTPQDVLVIDSLTMLCNAAMNFVLSMNARLGQPAQQGDWYAGQQMIESLMQMLYDENVKCNVIVNCHVVWIGDDGMEVGYPASLGKALSPKLGRYFNTILMAQTSGNGANAKKLIHTQSVGRIELKNTAPLRVQKSYPLESGLADYFRDVRTPGGGSVIAPTFDSSASISTK